MRTLGHTIASLGLLGTAGLLAPAVYLAFRAGGDPEGIVDGLLRLSWFMPIVWMVGMWLESDRQLSRARGLAAMEAPILGLLAGAAIFGLGVLNDGRVIVTEARPPSRAEQLRAQKGEAVRIEGDLGPLTSVGRWSETHLPKHPLPLGGGDRP